jgi:hypothetical protein
MKCHRLCAHRVLGVEDIRFSLLKAHRERLTVLTCRARSPSISARSFFSSLCRRSSLRPSQAQTARADALDLRACSYPRPLTAGELHDQLDAESLRLLDRALPELLTRIFVARSAAFHVRTKPPKTILNALRRAFPAVGCIIREHRQFGASEPYDQACFRPHEAGQST